MNFDPVQSPEVRDLLLKLVSEQKGKSRAKPYNDKGKHDDASERRAEIAFFPCRNQQEEKPRQCAEGDYRKAYGLKSEQWVHAPDKS